MSEDSEEMSEMPEMPEGESGISDDGTGAPDLGMQEVWIGLHEAYLTARHSGFSEMQALWLVGCLLKGLPIPDWMEERLSGDDDPN